MFRRRALGYLTVLLTAGIAGCGSSGGSGSTSALASDNVATIISEATTNTIAAQSVTVSGDISATFSFDVTIVRGLGCKGNVDLGAVKWKLIWVGKTVYAQSGSMPAGEWMRGASTASNVQGLINVCNPSVLLEPLSASGISSATRSVTVYDGQPALTLALPGTAKNNDQPGAIVVTDTQTPVLLNLSVPGAGKISFAGYGEVTTISPPAAG
jgi:hypothetical protein